VAATVSGRLTAPSRAKSGATFTWGKFDEMPAAPRGGATPLPYSATIR
jgi:hypothetical protein